MAESSLMNARFKRAATTGLILFSIFGEAYGADQRLTALARLWATVEFFHPRTADPSFDWDSAVVGGLKKVQTANNPAEMREALKPIVAVLQDPVTRVLDAPQSLAHWEANGDLTVRMLPGGVLLIAAEKEAKSVAFNNQVEALAKADAVVFDFRRRRSLQSTFDYSLLARSLSSRPLVAPGQRRRVYPRYNEAAVLVDGGRRIEPAPGARDKRVVFLLGSHTQPPDTALALQANGNARIVVEGSADESQSVETWRVKFPFDVEVQVRSSELVHADGSLGFQPDEVVAAGGLERAVALARTEVQRPSRNAAPPPPLVEARKPWVNVRFEANSSQAAPYPPEGQRLIAGYRLWSMVQLFDPYRGDTREEWDRVLEEFTTPILAAPNAEAYHLAIAEMISRAGDAHAVATSPIITSKLQPLPCPPFGYDMIQGKLVITRVLDVDDVSPGDIIHTIDGRSLEELKQYYARYSCCENASAGRALHGPDGSSVTIVVEGKDGTRRTLKFSRSRANYRVIFPARAGDPVQILPGNIGYVDLERFTASEIDAMLERFRNTNGIIFDLRGTAKFTSWPLAARLTRRPSPVAQQRFQRTVFSPAALLSNTVPEAEKGSNTDPYRDALVTDLVRLPATEHWRYEKPTVALINDWAASSPEISAGILRAATGTKLVGSRTSGAYGVRMIFSLPGGIRGSYTGAGFRLVDGTEAQRVGLQPDIQATPTIQGVRDGRDEVLERALLEFGVKTVVRGVGAAR
jgi:hypothetical protein